MTRRVVLTRERPTGRRIPAASLTVVLALGFLSACTSDDDPDGSAAPSAAPTSSATPSPTTTTTSAATEDPATAEVRCQRAQSQAAELPGMWRVVAAVTASETGLSAVGARRVRQGAARIADWLGEACDDLPPEAHRYLRDVRRHTAGDFGHPQLDRILTAWLRWGAAVGRPRPAERSIAGLDACRALMRDLSVTHRVWWRWTDTGRAWWIELTWDNRTGRTVNGETYGAVRVTGMLPDRFGWSAAAEKAGPGRRGTEGWGGSSSDVAWVRPGVSSQVVAPGIDQDVHTTRRGTFRITENEVYFYVPGRGFDSCRLPVPQRS